jgi:hypothetical protein
MPTLIDTGEMGKVFGESFKFLFSHFYFLIKKQMVRAAEQASIGKPQIQKHSMNQMNFHTI